MPNYKLLYAKLFECPLPNLRRYTLPDSNRRSPPVPRQGNRCRSAIDKTKTSIDVACSTQLSKSYRPRHVPGSPFWGRRPSGAVFRSTLTRRPTGVTLKRIGLTEQFPIIPKQRPHVKSFEKFLITAINFSVTLATEKKYKAGHSILARVNLHAAATQASFFFRVRRLPESLQRPPREISQRRTGSVGPRFRGEIKTQPKNITVAR